MTPTGKVTCREVVCPRLKIKRTIYLLWFEQVYEYLVFHSQQKKTNWIFMNIHELIKVRAKSANEKLWITNQIEIMWSTGFPGLELNA